MYLLPAALYSTCLYDIVLQPEGNSLKAPLSYPHKDNTIYRIVSAMPHVME